MRAGGALVAVRAPKDYRVTIWRPVQAAIPARACHCLTARPAKG